MLHQEQKCGTLSVRNGRYVCPRCKQPTHQKADPATQAEHLILWCQNCKAEYIVNIRDGQCSCDSQCPT